MRLLPDAPSLMMATRFIMLMEGMAIMTYAIQIMSEVR